MRHKDFILLHKIIPGAGICQFRISDNNEKATIVDEDMDEIDDDEDDVLRSLNNRLG